MDKGHKQKIVAMMPVRNEAARYLKEVLEHLSRWVTAIVILDDCSEDHTIDIASSFKKAIIYKNNASQFATDEPGLRARLWQLTLKENPDWIVALDGDEVFEDRIINEIGILINQNDYQAISFRLFDFWLSRQVYRIDGGWNPWQKSITLMVRYNAAIQNSWLQREVHCGRFPYAYENLPSYYSDIRVKHYGWTRDEDHYSKYLYYREKDLKVFGEIRPFTQSIQTPIAKIQMEEWRDAKDLYFLADREQ
ncbi:MAG TPA: glycosyltransferase family 2 protein [Syntrophomonadaceae bacterium]|nr:glycosyltransferase family 2 protein [Syntrophomonadaceae bacterium]